MNSLTAVFELLVERWDWFLELTIAHITLALITIVIGGLIGLVLGVLISEYQFFAPFVITVCNVVYTIPSISLLGFLIPILGVGNKTAITALVIYAIMPMVRNTYTGMSSIDKDIIEAARGMGSTNWQILTRIKIPLSMSIIIAGVRNMVVMTIAVAGIASYIGAGGLGVAIYRGISIYNPTMTFIGSALIAILAFVADFFLGKLEKHFYQ